MQGSREQQRKIRKPSEMNPPKKSRKTIEWERLEISSRKLEISREHLMQRQAKNKGQKWQGPDRNRRY